MAEEKENVVQPETEQNNNNNEAKEPISFSYEKIQQMLDGTLKAKEEVALKSYFKQQGLSQEEVETAIADFKAKKKESTPDVNALNEKISKSEAAKRVAEVKAEALAMHQELGVEIGTVGYLLKLADTSNVFGEDGNIDNTKLKEALSKVIEDIPQFKKSTEANGFKQVGAGKTQDTGKEAEDLMRKRFGLSPKK